MSLVFGGATSDRVVVTAAASINNLAAMTVIAYVFPTTLTANRILYSKDNGAGANVFLQLNGTLGNVLFNVGRATTPAQALSSDVPLGVLSRWYCIAATWDGATAPRIYSAPLGGSLAERMYGSSQAGSGAQSDDSANNLVWGNDGVTLAFPGSIDISAVFGAALSLTDLQAWMDEPKPTIGSNTAKGYWRLGQEGTGNQTDFSGNANTGATTGASQGTFPMIVAKPKYPMAWQQPATPVAPQFTSIDGAYRLIPSLHTPDAPTTARMAADFTPSPAPLGLIVPVQSTSNVIQATGASTATASSVTAVSLDLASAAGGATLVITGTGFANIGAGDVLVGTQPANNVVRDSAIQITCTTPAQSGITALGSSMGVTVADKTLANAIVIYPAITTTYATQPDDGTLGVFGTNITTGTVQAKTTLPRPGSGHTYSIESAVTGSFAGSGAGLAYNFSGAVKNAPITGNGLWTRWYLCIPSATITDINGGGHQAKQHLLRVGGTQPPNGYTMLGVGNGFPPGSVMVQFDDGTTGGTINNATAITFGDGVWREMLLFQYRSGSVGYSRLWSDRRLVASGSNADVGSDSAAVEYDQWLLLVYTQSTSNLLAYCDSAKLANGCIDP